MGPDQKNKRNNDRRKRNEVREATVLRRFGNMIKQLLSRRASNNQLHYIIAGVATDTKTDDAGSRIRRAAVPISTSCRFRSKLPGSAS